MRSFKEFNEEVEKIRNKKSAAYGSEVDTSPSKNKIEKGTYKKAHTRIDGLEIAIENPLGSTRSGVDPDGKKWSITMKSDYGYFKGSVGFDKDHVDTFIKPGYKGGNDKVHVVNQVCSKGKFDEHKVIMGATSNDEAMKLYLSNYEKGWSLGKSVVEMPLTDFKTWVKSNEPKKGALSKLKKVSEIHRPV